MARQSPGAALGSRSWTRTRPRSSPSSARAPRTTAAWGTTSGASASPQRPGALQEERRIGNLAVLIQQEHTVSQSTRWGLVHSRHSALVSGPPALPPRRRRRAGAPSAGPQRLRISRSERSERREMRSTSIRGASAASDENASPLMQCFGKNPPKNACFGKNPQLLLPLEYGGRASTRSLGWKNSAGALGGCGACGGAAGAGRDWVVI